MQVASRGKGIYGGENMLNLRTAGLRLAASLASLACCLQWTETHYQNHLTAGTETPTVTNYTRYVVLPLQYATTKTIIGQGQ